jgi:hypothetical protein
MTGVHHHTWLRSQVSETFPPNIYPCCGEEKKCEVRLISCSSPSHYTVGDRTYLEVLEIYKGICAKGRAGCGKWTGIRNQAFFLSFFLFFSTGFELRASCMLDRHALYYLSYSASTRTQWPSVLCKVRMMTATWPMKTGTFPYQRFHLGRKT